MDDEIQHLRSEIARLQKIINEKQQIADPPTSLINNADLIEDMARFAAGSLDRQQIKTKWRKLIDDQMWETLGNDDALVERIEKTKIARLRSGATKRELAQMHIVRGPSRLATIMDDPKANYRHVVDAIKTLDGMSDTGPQATPAADRFVIHIDLTADAKLKGIEPNPRDVIDLEVTLPQKTPAAITDQSEDDWKR